MPMSQLFEMDNYIIQTKFWRFFGGAFWFKDLNDQKIAYCKQKRFKWKEDIILYTDETCTQPLLQIKARSVIDLASTYDVTDIRTGEHIGSTKREFLKSIFKDSWKLLDPQGNQYGELIEDSNSLLRRFIPLGGLIPAKFHLEIPGNNGITLHQQFNPFIMKSLITIPPGHQMDRRMIVAIALLNSAIEGRQR
jgi:uncharacterized protein YxjI